MSSGYAEPTTVTLLSEIIKWMSLVDYAIDAFIEPPPQEGAAVEEYYTYETDCAEHAGPVTGVLVRSRRQANGTRDHRVLSYTCTKRSESQVQRDLRKLYCKYCSELLPVGKDFFVQPHCCAKAYLFNTQRHIHRCMMEMQFANIQRLRCKSLLDRNKITAIIELRFEFSDGLMRQVFVTSDDYCVILRQSVTREDIKQWGLPFAPLCKTTFLTYPATCKFVKRIYAYCVSNGLLPNLDLDDDQPIELAIRETDGNQSVTSPNGNGGGVHIRPPSPLDGPRLEKLLKTDQ